MLLEACAVGLAVGILVGLTGMGGGAVMTPVLVLLGWARPVVAVGTDLMWGTLTKSVGGFVHFRQGTVDLKIVKRLALGSVPGSLAGLALLAHLQTANQHAADQFVVRALGIVLILVALMLFIRSSMRPRVQASSESARVYPWGVTSVVGAFVGFLVSLTSVGSGSLIVACLAMIYPSTPLKRIVGSDIFHAVILVGVSALGHLEIGTIDVRLLGSLLLGSIPGVWLGSKMSGIFPEKILRPVLGSTLLFLGYKLL
jgi:uncharacterized protein